MKDRPIDLAEIGLESEVALNIIPGDSDLAFYESTIIHKTFFKVASTGFKLISIDGYGSGIKTDPFFKG
jgi:hypothetical protein